MTNPHPDFEALSAHHDGEAPELAAHVTGCPACRTTLRWLRITTALVSSPVPPAPGAVREKALARALEAFGAVDSVRGTTEETVAGLRRSAPVPVTRSSDVPPGGRSAPPTPITSARSRRWSGSRLWVGVGSAAAVLLAFVLGVGVLTGGGGGVGDDDATVAAGAPPTQERTAGDANSTLNAEPGFGVADTGATGAAAAGGVDGGDLGEITDASVLVARARPALLQRDAAPAPAPVTGIAPAGAGEPGLTSKFVGTRPCEMEARTDRPDLGTVVYYAVGRVGGLPVVVLGFAPGPAPAPVTLLALARQEGCRVVLEAAGP